MVVFVLQCLSDAQAWLLILYVLYFCRWKKHVWSFWICIFLLDIYVWIKKARRKEAGGGHSPVSTCGREVRAGRWQMRGGGLGNDKSALGGSGGPAEEQVTATAVWQRVREGVRCVRRWMRGPGESLPAPPTIRSAPCDARLPCFGL